MGDGISEMRIDFGPGYRLYFTRRGQVVYLLLLGRDKASQRQDLAHRRFVWVTTPCRVSGPEPSGRVRWAPKAA